MPLMLSKTYEALVAADAPEEKAREAAEEIAGYENRLVKIETELVTIRETMATKTCVLSAMLTQTFAILGGVAALLRLLH
jgi:phage shock protein A